MLAVSTPQHGIKAQANLGEKLDGAVLESEQGVLSEIAWFQQLRIDTSVLTLVNFEFLASVSPLLFRFFEIGFALIGKTSNHSWA
jgi:hypothetical protein